MIRWGVYCEDEGDSKTLRAFVLRVLSEIGADWVRVQLDLDASGATLIEWNSHKLKDISARIRALDVRPLHGHFNRRPAEDGAAQARNAWHLERAIAQKSSDPAMMTDVVFVLRDADGKRSERADGQRQALLVATDHDHPCTKPTLLAALAIEEREAWVLAALVPNDEERRRLDAQRKSTGLQLDEDLDQLGNDGPTSPRDLKRVLAAIVGDDAEARELESIELVPVEQLARRGERVGLWSALESIASWWIRCQPECVDRERYQGFTRTR